MASSRSEQSLSTKSAEPLSRRATDEATDAQSGEGERELLSTPSRQTEVHSEEQLESIETDCEAIECPLVDPHINQHMVRSQTNEGCESVVAYFRVVFPAGHLLHVVHVPFWPSLPSLPEVQSTQLFGSSVTIKIARIERFGLRLELSLKQVEQTICEVGIEVVATCHG
ncbi:MAG TPA: hypothetical protein PKD64_12140 [Pirellulaceae bacterium]|nr:hypothetical protein [Pirellulaceae bacterium]HMP68499.1 hypothetical protein [Pirellulaceae bacterium]